MNDVNHIKSKSTEVLTEGLITEPNRRIGNYLIVGTIGEGGMGTVYLAQQEKPIKRKVALKIIKPGIQNKEVIARFESERQALALMTHPNIAQLFEAGETEDGVPFFVMEYVPGSPITNYCDQHKLPNETRLKIFIDVCDALQHAHYKGIIHRDIKPSNILVIQENEKHVPKIIDFGIAKALSGQSLSERTLYTQLGMAIGTPVYMSPEQAELNNADTDTRSDIYSMGVLLYELLIGVPPFEKAEIQKAGLLEMLRRIREEEPPPMSSKFKSLGKLSTEISEKRSSSEAIILKQIKGDVENIVFKALEKDKNRRYDSAKDFGMDIRRFLDNEPIQAKSSGVFYKLKKFVKRNQSRVIVFSTVFFLCVAILSSIILYVKRTGQYLLVKEQVNIMATPGFVKGVFYRHSMLEGNFTIGPVNANKIKISSANRRIVGPKSHSKSVPAWLQLKLIKSRNEYSTYEFKIKLDSVDRVRERLVLQDLENARHCWFDIELNIADDQNVKRDILFIRSPINAYDSVIYSKTIFLLNSLTRLLLDNSVRGNFVNALPENISRFSLVVILSVNKELGDNLSKALYDYVLHGGNVLFVGGNNLQFFGSLFKRLGFSINIKFVPRDFSCTAEDIVDHEITRGCKSLFFFLTNRLIIPGKSPIKMLARYPKNPNEGFIAVYKNIGQVVFVLDGLDELLEKEQLFLNIINLKSNKNEEKN